MIFCVLQDFLCFAGFFIVKTGVFKIWSIVHKLEFQKVNLQKVFSSIFCKLKSEESSLRGYETALCIGNNNNM